MMMFTQANSFRKFLFLLVIIASGCGGGDYKSAPAGFNFDATYIEDLEIVFHEAEACSGLVGDFSELSIVQMPPYFPCRWAQYCMGEYLVPNTIKIGSLYQFKHEVIHYLLWKNTGVADADHADPLFIRCA